MPQRRRAAWLGRDRLVTRVIARPVLAFLRIEAAGGVLLLAATVAALLWVASPWSGGYERLWTTELGFSLGSTTVSAELRHAVNDGLMALFFLVVGLEIKRELVGGQLSSARDAALPAIAALGGMVVPALIFVAWNIGGDGANGWGIPMATDIAFAVGVLTLLGRRVPSELKVLLLGIAIADDIGAIAVIAVFYTSSISLPWLLVALAGLAAYAALPRVGVWRAPVYVAIGIGIWFATLQSGIHATIAGVAIGLLTPARARPARGDAQDGGGRAPGTRGAVPVSERAEDVLHPWTSYVVIPVFALANAGVALSASDLRAAAGSRVTIGVVVGLVLGKLIGVTGAIALAVRTGIGRLPPAVSRRHVVGLGALAGIGFTVSLFVTGLAFDDPRLTADAKIGVLAATVVAAVIGTVVLTTGSAGRTRT